jgi:hypothetical protein
MWTTSGTLVVLLVVLVEQVLLVVLVEEVLLE